MWPWKKKNKEPEIVFLDGGKEPDYEKIRQLAYGYIAKWREELQANMNEKEKTMNDIILGSVKLKKDERGYYLRLKYIQETDNAISEIIIPKYRLPIKTDDIIIRHDTCPCSEIEANIGFGFFPLENGVTEHSDDKEVVFTVKELKKKVHKMTVADIEKKLGYKIEIVSEESEG